MRILKAVTALLLVCCLFAGCNAAGGEKASVQAVSMITATGSVGLQNRFAGMVSARSEVSVEKDENREVTEILVKEGDAVEAGQVLFKYDTEQASLLVEKAELELEQMKAEIKAKESARAQLEKEKQKASKDEQLSYTLEIQACDAAIREGQYNLKLKEKEVGHLKESLTSTEVLSPVSGEVTSMNTNGDVYDSQGQKKPYITLMESGTYRVRGTFNENNAGQIMEGVRVRILSRVDDSVWTGTVSQIDWEHPVSRQNGYAEEPVYEGATIGSGASASSSYPFYIEMDESEGLRLGQHVYIELFTGGDPADPDALTLPSCYLVDFTEEGASVWAQNSRGRLEKRAVTLGVYDAEADTYVITDGLTREDYIAFPDDTLKEGMKCTIFDESAFESEGEYFEEGGGSGAGEVFVPTDDGAVAEEALPADEMPVEGMGEPVEDIGEPVEDAVIMD